MALFMGGLLCVLATSVHAHDDISGRLIAAESAPKKWKSEDGQELFELRTAGNALFFERITPPQDQIYGEFFRGEVRNEGARYFGTAAAAVLQIAESRATHLCTIQMSVTLSSVTPARIDGNVRPQRIDPDCTPNNFSATMTGRAFGWVPAAQNDVPLPQVQRRIEASRQYRRRMEASAQEYRKEAQNRQADLQQRQRPNHRLRECEAALRQQQLTCSAHYPYTYPGRPHLPPLGACSDAQSAVRVACY